MGHPVKPDAGQGQVGPDQDDEVQGRVEDRRVETPSGSPDSAPADESAFTGTTDHRRQAITRAATTPEDQIERLQDVPYWRRSEVLLGRTAATQELERPLHHLVFVLSVQPEDVEHVLDILHEMSEEILPLGKPGIINSEATTAHIPCITASMGGFRRLHNRMLEEQASRSVDFRILALPNRVETITAVNGALYLGAPVFDHVNEVSAGTRESVLLPKSGGLEQGQTGVINEELAVDPERHPTVPILSAEALKRLAANGIPVDDALDFVTSTDYELPSGVFGRQAALFVDLHGQPSEARLFALTQASNLALSQEVDGTTLEAEYFTTVSGDHLVVVGHAESAGGYLASEFPASIKAGVGSAKMIIVGNLDIDSARTSQGIPRATRLPNAAEFDELRRKAGTGIFTTEIGEEGLSESRAGKVVNIIVKPPRRPEATLRPVETSSGINLVPFGSPDQMIGFEEEMAQIEEMMAPNSRVRYGRIQGRAGTGKSRFLDEIRKRHPKALILAANPALANKPWHGLATICHQVCEYLETQQTTDRRFIVARVFNDLIAKFRGKSPDERSKIVKNQTNEIKSLLKHALLLVAKLTSESIFLDDSHELDISSDPVLMGIITEVANDPDFTQTFFTLDRPEERYSSIAQKTTEARIKEVYGPKAVATISTQLKDKTPKVNPKNPELRTIYVLSTLRGAGTDVYQPGDEETQAFKTLAGDWDERISAQSQTPYEMTEILKILLRAARKEGERSIFLVEDDRISLTEKALELLGRVAESESLQQFQIHQLHELPTEDRRLVQVLAFIGSRFNLEQILNIANVVLGISFQDSVRIVDELAETGYLIETESTPQRRFKFAHDNVRETILQSTETDEAGKTLGITINERVNAANEATKEVIFADLSTDDMFNMLDSGIHHKSLTAEGIPHSEDRGLWTNYCQRAAHSMTNALEARRYGEAYSYAIKVLEGFDRKVEDIRPQTPGAIAQVRARMANGQSVDTQIASLVGHALFIVAEAGGLIGKFKKVDQAVLELDRMKAHTENGVRHFYVNAEVAGFTAAYVSNDTERSRNAYERLNRFVVGADGERTTMPVSPAQLLLMDLKNDFKAAGKAQSVPLLQACMARFNDDTLQHQMRVLRLMPDRDRQKAWANQMLTEFDRIKERTEMEIIHFQLKQNIDEDTLFVPNYLNHEAREKLEGQRQSLQKIRDEHNENTSPISILATIEQLAWIEGFLGNHEEAATLFGETWRIASQLGIHREAARAKKLQGDALVLQALSSYEKTEEGGHRIVKAIKTPLTDTLRKATRAYTTAVESADQVEDGANGAPDEFRFITRVQAARGIAIQLSETPHPDLSDQENIALAHQGIDFILEITNDPLWNSWLEHGQVSHYLSPYAAILGNLGAAMHNMTRANGGQPELLKKVQALTQTNTLSAKALINATEYAKDKLCDPLGEMARKLGGLAIGSSLYRNTPEISGEIAEAISIASTKLGLAA
jgi:hypothetical protein